MSRVLAGKPRMVVVNQTRNSIQNLKSQLPLKHRFNVNHYAEPSGLQLQSGGFRILHHIKSMFER